MKKLVLLSIACAVMFTVSGCSYYKVIDPGSGRVYYTSHVHRKGSGSIRFKDDVTRTEVTLSSSEVIPISKDQFKAGVHGR